ncbi:MAG: DUF2892 domain-containing protein [Anaerolineae bacterium]|nr:DUF2892 domain-containing protein [Anaerolineae bacterium]
MFYPKNVPVWERTVRIVIGIVLVITALADQALFGTPSLLRIVLLIGSALFLVVTGFIGWCPACAMIGRKIKQKQS